MGRHKRWQRARRCGQAAGSPARAGWVARLGLVTAAAVLGPALAPVAGPAPGPFGAPAGAGGPVARAAELRLGSAAVEVGGEVGHYLFQATEQGALLQNELRYRLSFKARPPWDGQVAVVLRGTGGLGGTAGPAALFEPPPASAWPELDEAYVDVYWRSADLRVGRQLVRWGTADGINPTDVVNPRSLTLDALVDREVRVLPVPALRLSLGGGAGWGLTAVGVADFVAAPFPEQAVRQVAERVLAGMGGQALSTSWLSLTGPSGSPNPEAALRVEGMVRDVNVYLSYFSGYEDLPALWMQPIPPSTWQVQGRYRRQQQWGLALAGAAGRAGLWAEAALRVPERVAQLDASPAALAFSSNRSSWQAVAGGDYTFDGDLHVSGQLVYNEAGSLLLPYEPQTARVARTYALGTVRYAPAEARYAAEGVVLWDLRDGGAIVVPGVSYELRPGLKLAVRYVEVLGSQDSQFGQLRAQLRGLATRLVVAF